MVESDLIGSVWLGVVMVETRQVREEGNWVCLEDANVKVGEFVGRAKEVRKGQQSAGVLETNRPDAKNALYQATIKQGDFLLNRIQKLSRVVDL
nr:26s proteasome non-atpase regulatory subunit 6 like [Quercus suber]